MSKRTVIVTGAARGIGLATARLMIADDWQVIMVDRDAQTLYQAAEDLDRVKAIECDVSSPDDINAMIDIAMSEFGQVDALVNNAGVAEFQALDKTDFATWRRVMATNLDGVFLCSQATIPALKDSSGSIVNIASISGLRASTLRTAYGTSKAAVIQLTKQQAAELGEFGVRVNCVCPGPVRTKLAMAVHTPQIVDAYHDAIPLNRYGSEEEIANMISYLCSDKASFITGQIISVDGGFESTGVGLPALRQDAND
ncbi:MAG: SDR family oxidoreductase [Granulosicoccus sp.]|nr:SDR family oxidoreductase [Granulosicoccus sp.]